MRHSHVFSLCAIILKLIHFVLQLIALCGIANQCFRVISSIQNVHRKTVKPQFAKIEKQNVYAFYVDLELLMHYGRIWPYLCRPSYD